MDFRAHDFLWWKKNEKKEMNKKKEKRENSENQQKRDKPAITERLSVVASRLAASAPTLSTDDIHLFLCCFTIKVAAMAFFFFF